MFAIVAAAGEGSDGHHGAQKHQRCAMDVHDFNGVMAALRTRHTDCRQHRKFVGWVDEGIVDDV